MTDKNGRHEYNVIEICAKCFSSSLAPNFNRVVADLIIGKYCNSKTDTKSMTKC